MIVTANLVDLHSQKIYYAAVETEGERIQKITRLGDERPDEPYLLPGFVDAHVHIESSMLVPSQFARLAVVHGTVATVSDPHEIANVCGTAGVDYMINEPDGVPFKFYFGAPSCVPATTFETAGAAINAAEIELMLQRKEIVYLAEMMNFPGVLHGYAEVMQKIAAAKRCNKPVDGHAPGLRGADAKKYIEAGPSTDHECFTLEEAEEKLSYGCKILIREGSAAKNFEALWPLLHQHSAMCMFCSDDKHPDSLVQGHINQLCARAVAYGVDVFKVLQAACVNPVVHYGLKVGLLREADFADFILVDDLQHFRVRSTVINGQVVAEEGVSKLNPPTAAIINNFSVSHISTDDLKVVHRGADAIPAIEALDGQLITNKLMLSPKVEDGFVVSDVDNDVLKIVVVNRYKSAPPAIGFIKNFGLKGAAIASSVAHDSHNVVAVGTDDLLLTDAINAVMHEKGGISIRTASDQKILPLPVAGLMSTDDGYKVAEAYEAMDTAAKAAGSGLASPYMTLSFMALLVIPHLKMSDKGLFDGDQFALLSPVS